MVRKYLRLSSIFSNLRMVAISFPIKNQGSITHNRGTVHVTGMGEDRYEKRAQCVRWSEASGMVARSTAMLTRRVALSFLRCHGMHIIITFLKEWTRRYDKCVF